MRQLFIRCTTYCIICLLILPNHKVTIILILQEAKMLIARAYRNTEKLLLDNRDKLTLVSCSFL